MSSNETPENHPLNAKNKTLVRALTDIILFPIAWLEFIVIMPLNWLIKRQRRNQRELNFSRLSLADTIDIYTNMGQKVKSITDAPIVKTVVEFIQSRPNRWYTPLYGVPVCSLNCHFLSGDESLGHVGISPNGLEAFPVIKELKQEEGKQLYVLMGIEDQL